jgi:hypothetical protein
LAEDERKRGIRGLTAEIEFIGNKMERLMSFRRAAPFEIPKKQLQKGPISDRPLNSWTGFLVVQVEISIRFNGTSISTGSAAGSV